MTEALGHERVLLGFPGAAAIPCDESIQFVILDRREQPTTIGELDGCDSKRIDSISAALQAAGFPTSICPNMDAWLKTHVAEILPTACALYKAGCDIEALKHDRSALVLMSRAIREGHRVLSALGVPNHAIEPQDLSLDSRVSVRGDRSAKACRRSLEHQNWSRNRRET